MRLGTALQLSLPELYITFWIFNKSAPIKIHDLSEARKIIENIQYLSKLEANLHLADLAVKESKEYSEWLSSKLWDKGAAVTLPWEQNSIIHIAFQHVLLEELVTWQWLTAASRLNSYPLLCFVANVPLSHLLAAVIALFCRQYDIIKDNDSSNNKEKAKPSSERSTPEHHSGGLLRSKVKSQRPHRDGNIWIRFLLSFRPASNSCIYTSK